MPFVSVPVDGTENVDVNSPVVAGGIEKFTGHLNREFDINTVNISKEDRAKRLTTKIIASAIGTQSPDIIILNSPWMYSTAIRNSGVPVIMFVHEGLQRDIRMVNLGSLLKQMINDGVHIYYVSERQFLYHKSLVKRIENIDIDISDIKGFINPSYCENTVFSEDLIYDSVTIGRTDITKNPFKLHELVQGSQYTSLVMTNGGTYKSEAQNKYVEKHKHWQAPQHTFRLLPHSEVIQNLSKSKVFVSTCPIESWGTTAMEALGCGIPLILLTDATGIHSSQNIAADPSHYINLSVKSSKKDFISTMETLMDIPTSKRREIYEMTNEKHSKEKWIKTFDTIFNKCYDDRTVSNLSSFFGDL